VSRILGLDLGDPGGAVVLTPNGQFGAVLHWQRLGNMNLARLRRVVEHVIETFDVEVVATERPFIGGHARVTASQHKKASVVETICEERGVRYVAYAPASVKKAITGNGRASKEQMMRAVRSLLRFEAPDEHVADACSIAAVAMSRECGP